MSPFPKSSRPLCAPNSELTLNIWKVKRKRKKGIWAAGHEKVNPPPSQRVASMYLIQKRYRCALFMHTWQSLLDEVFQDIGKPSASPNFGVLSRSYLGRPLILQQHVPSPHFSSPSTRFSISLHTSRSARSHGLVALPASRLPRFSLRTERETERTKNEAAAAAVKERNSIGCRPNRKLCLDLQRYSTLFA
uniref:Uncharacterized protein n=1 Tax=Setaria italica TaxID=4555 RepID=K3ZJY9_SETIT